MEKKEKHKGAGHRKRLRDRFLESGLDGFHDYEVIELLLTLGTPRKDCKGPAKAVLKRFKTLKRVFEASPEELAEVEGIGTANQFGIHLVMAVAERYQERKIIENERINNSKELFEYLSISMRGTNRECFKVIFLDAKNRIITMETLFRGTLTESSVYSREVVSSALNHHAAALIFAHNHPSGDPAPSREDFFVTRRLLFACKIVGITVHEHIIIGDNAFFSFADEGHIAQMNREFLREQKE